MRRRGSATQETTQTTTWTLEDVGACTMGAGVAGTDAVSVGAEGAAVYAEGASEVAQCRGLLPLA